MTDQSETPPPQSSPPGAVSQTASAWADQGSTAGSAGSPSSPVSSAQAIVEERPEVAVGAAFAGGLVLAVILKRLAR